MKARATLRSSWETRLRSENNPLVLGQKRVALGLTPPTGRHCRGKSWTGVGVAFTAVMDTATNAIKEIMLFIAVIE